MEESEKPRLSDAPTAELGFALPEPAKLSRGRALTFGVLGVLVLGGVYFLVALPRKAARAELSARPRAPMWRRHAWPSRPPSSSPASAR